MNLQLRVIVKGPIQGSFILKAPVSSISIGRSNECQVAIADISMSRAHFSLSWDGRQAILTDLNTTNGTSVNGILVKQTILQNGDAIIAGDTTFRIVIERNITSAADVDTSKKSIQSQQSSYDRLQLLPVFGHIAITHQVLENKLNKNIKKNSLLEQLVKVIQEDKSSHWYAIIDAAKVSSLAYKAKTMGYPVYTLFMGDTAQDLDLASVGPCVIKLEMPLPFIELWVGFMGENAGVLLQTKANVEMDVLYAHLRNIFIARDEKNEDYFFRYYDPGVLNVYLPTCTDDELGEFFGVVNQWLCEDKKDNKYRLLKHHNNALNIITI